MANLKMTLAALGVKNLAIKFNCEQKNIEARYTLYGQDHQKQISFQDIENAFADSDSANATPARIDKPTISGP